MTCVRRVLIVALCGLALELSPALAQAADTKLFDNGADLQFYDAIGTSLGDIGTSINGPSRVSDDFTLGSSAVLTSVTFGEDSFMHLVDTVAPVPLSVEWSIGTAPFSGSVASGTAGIVATSGTPLANTGDRGWNYSSSFALPGLALGPGTYWLTLGNGTNTDTGTDGQGALTAWSASNATAGNAEQFIPPQSAGAGISAKNAEMAFQIFGVPEPALPVVAACAALVVALRRRRSEYPLHRSSI